MFKGALNIASVAVIFIVLALVGGSALAEGNTSGGGPAGGTPTLPTPVFEETAEPVVLDIKELPTTGSGSTAKEIKAGLQYGFHHWHFQETRCSYGRLYYVYHAHTINHYFAYTSLGQVIHSWQGYC